MLSNEKLINLEKKYFHYISEIIEAHLGEILNQIASNSNISSTATPGSKSNIFDNKLENIIESLITRQLGWNILATPISADSCYECGDAIIHIDAKTRCEKVWDAKKNDYKLNTDYIKNKIVAEKNETTYDSSQQISYDGKMWKANLSHYVEHKIYGTVPNLTYFFVMDYSLDNTVLKLSLVSIPNGQFYNEFKQKIIGAGKGSDSENRNNIRFLVNEITSISDNNWREKVLYIRNEA